MKMRGLNFGCNPLDGRNLALYKVMKTQRAKK